MITLVTGAAGFIGSELCTRLVGLGDHVIGIDDLSTGRTENIRHLDDCAAFEFIHGSAADRSLLAPLVGRSDRVMHLAASVGVARIVASPAQTMENNLSMALVVGSLAVEHGLPLLVTSSSEVYGRAGRIALVESDDRLVGPTDVPRWSYAAAKAAEESLVLAHGASSGVPVTVARMFNTAGPRQSAHYGMVLPRFVEAALAGRPLEVFGDGEQTRCFLHVDDAVDALLALTSRECSEPLVCNVGGDRSISIRALAELVIGALASSSPIVHVDPCDRYGKSFDEPEHRRPDTGRIRSLTGWVPQRSLETIIEDTIRFRRAARDAELI